MAGLARPSTSFRVDKSVGRSCEPRRVDGRAKPGHDALIASPAQSPGERRLRVEVVV
jgi:hypothetical protein